MIQHDEKRGISTSTAHREMQPMQQMQMQQQPMMMMGGGGATVSMQTPVRQMAPSAPAHPSQGGYY